MEQLEPWRQVDLVSVEHYPDSNIIRKFTFTLHNGGALWVYTPMVGMIEGEDSGMWTVGMWLEQWVDYPVPSDQGRRELHLARLESFHGDLNDQL